MTPSERLRAAWLDCGRRVRRWICCLGAAVLIAIVAAGCDRGNANRAGAAFADGTATAADLRPLVDSLLPRLERLSGLRATGPVRMERQNARQVRAFVERQLADEMPPAVLRGIRATYVMLGLVPDTLDLRALLLDLYTEQIVGYYDPDTRTLYVVEGVSRDAVRPVLAHELVHALQDQHTNLDSLIDRRRGNDRRNAAQAALEGHATLVMFALLAADASGRRVDPAMLPDPAEQLRPAMDGNSQFPVFRRAPRAIREELLFPYVAGASFVRQLWRSRPGESRPPPLDSLLPQSTEQVMHPLTAFIHARDVPTELRFTTSPAWTLLREGTFGELDMRLYLQQHLGETAGRAARGWDGDHYRLFEAPGGGHVLVWYSIWDTDAAAATFAATARRAADADSTRAAAVQRSTLDGRPVVRVVLADSASMLQSLPPMAVSCANVAGTLERCSAH